MAEDLDDPIETETCERCDRPWWECVCEPDDEEKR